MTAGIYASTLACRRRKYGTEIEAGWEHTDDDHGLLIERDRLPDNRRGRRQTGAARMGSSTEPRAGHSFEFPLSRRSARARVVRPMFRRSFRPPARCNLLRLSTARQGVLSISEKRVVAGHALKGPIMALKFLVCRHRVRHAGKSSGLAQAGVQLSTRREPGELLGVREWQRPQQNCIHHAEDRGICADTQSQNQHCDDRKAAISPQCAKRIPKILCTRAPVVTALLCFVPFPYLRSSPAVCTAWKSPNCRSASCRAASGFQP